MTKTTLQVQQQSPLFLDPGLKLFKQLVFKRINDVQNIIREEIIQSLRRYAQENNGILTYHLYRQKKYSPSDTTIRNKWYTEDKVIKILQNVSEDGNSITVEEYKKQRQQPSIETIVSLFGSWNDAIKKVGLRENRVLFTDEEMIQAIQDYAKEKGKFTITDFKKDKIQPSYDSILKLFGSWTNEFKKSGINPILYIIPTNKF